MQNAWCNCSSSFPHRLFDDLQTRSGSIGRWVWWGIRLLGGIEYHSLPVLSGVDTQNRFNGHGNVGGDAAKASIESNELVTHIEPHYGGWRDVQYYLPIADIGLRYFDTVCLNID